MCANDWLKALEVRSHVLNLLRYLTGWKHYPTFLRRSISNFDSHYRVYIAPDTTKFRDYLKQSELPILIQPKTLTIETHKKIP